MVVVVGRAVVRFLSRDYISKPKQRRPVVAIQHFRKLALLFLCAVSERLITCKRGSIA